MSGSWDHYDDESYDGGVHDEDDAFTADLDEAFAAGKHPEPRWVDDTPRDTDPLGALIGEVAGRSIGLFAWARRRLAIFIGEAHR